MAREIKVVVDDINNTNPIFVVDGNIYVLAGNAAMITKLDASSPVERECAIGPNDNCDLARHIKEEYEQQNKQTTEAPKNQNCENIGFDPSAYKVDNTDFDKAVDFLCRCSGEDFLELVKYAEKHDNTFWHCVSEVADVVNADDAYCSAIIKLSRPLGESVEKKAFELFNEAIEKDEYDFVQFWTALQTINYFCN